MAAKDMALDAVGYSGEVGRPRRSGLATPDLVIDYAVYGLWTMTAATDTRAFIRNPGGSDALRITISDIVLDRDTRCRFAGIPRVAPGETIAIDPAELSEPIERTAWMESLKHSGPVAVADGLRTPHEARLTQMLSRTIVRQVLRGDAPTAHWTLRLEYEDVREGRYTTVCEIRLVRLPLELEATTVLSAGPRPFLRSARTG